MSMLKRFFSEKTQQPRLPTFSNKELDTFFTCTSATWLYNRQQQFEQRHIKFDVYALISEAMKVAGAHRCDSFTRLAEGTCNRTFLVKLDNQELVAKIPFPIAGPEHFMTASEVATMEYARTKLQLPVPKVLGWSSRASATPVGSEYILMEKVPGDPLVERWEALSGQNVYNLITSWAQMEGKWANTPFSQIGSIYFTEDVAEHLKSRHLYAEGVPEDEHSHRFRIGPSVSRQFWRGERAKMNVDRGPWTTPQEYARAIAESEIAWLQQYACPHDVNSPLYRNERDNVPSEHVALLQRFLKLVPFLWPPSVICQPCLWHPDLHASNVFISSTDPIEYTGIIDWQSSLVAPLYLQASIPHHLQYFNNNPVPIPSSDDDEAPQLPPDFDQLNSVERKAAELAQKGAARLKLYTLQSKKYNPPGWAAMELNHELPGFHTTPLYMASRTWDEGMAPLRDSLINLVDAWDQIGPKDGTTCPVEFSESEREAHDRDFADWLDDQQLHRFIEDVEGWQEDGWVRNEDYDRVKRKVDSLREKLVEERKHQWQKDWIRRRWPVQDGALSVQAESCR